MRYRNSFMGHAEQQLYKALNAVTGNLSGEDEINATKQVYDYFIRILLTDFIAGTRASITERQVPPSETWYRFPFLPPINKKACTEMNCQGYYVLAQTWAIDRWGNAFCDIREEGFSREKSDAYGYYFPELDFIVVEEGYHHISAAEFLNQGSLPVFTVHLSDYYSKFFVDDEYWYDIGNRKLIPILDWRIAFLFHLLQLKAGCAIESSELFQKRENFQLLDGGILEQENLLQEKEYHREKMEEYTNRIHDIKTLKNIKKS